MMKAEELKILQDKYWAGETSLQEEVQLRKYYNTLPEEKDPLKAIFQYADRQREIKYEGTIVAPMPAKRTFDARKWMGIAASLIVLVAAVWMFNSDSSRSNETVIDDPEVALQLTKDALAFLNGKIDESSIAVKDGMSHLDKTLIFKNL